ncbi:helix-turn-helix transcriptional regulator [Lactobacillus sp. UMNPBX4]|uniref:helix-turn-helix domain-containing protein n=1 Tax=Lactobacillus sp. UMNPBX4 TaxID=2042043 RepID=UPI000BEEC9EC|nr:helix-turn-helix transcriptional regulator [Lactobacillus sp. UMNPBX4]PEH06936.1 hypothetical protein CP355_01080 [Lactobacillus sp. UMNPBX4]
MNRIKKLRERQNIGQKELAQKIGVTQQAISLYEKGQRKPKFETYIKLAKFFNVPVTYITGMSDVKDMKVYDNFENWLEHVAVEYSDSKGAKVARNEAMALAREITLKQFDALFKAVEYSDSVTNEKELEKLRDKISSSSEMSDVVFLTGSTFQLALKAKTGDGKAQKAYNQINKIINNYFGYDDEEEIYEIQGKDNK